MPGSNTERKREAFKLYSRGYNAAEVTAKVGVSYATARRYQRQWQDQAHDEARQNPRLLQDILVNTIRMLNELDQIRQSAWEDYENSVNPQVRQGYLNTMLRAQEQRGKLLAVFGVKQEFISHLQNVQRIQTALMEFMRLHLCEEDRDKLEQFFLRELGDYIEGEVVDVQPAALEA